MGLTYCEHLTDQPTLLGLDSIAQTLATPFVASCHQNRSLHLDCISKKSQRRGSNPRPAVYKTAALPTELRWRKFIGLMNISKSICPAIRNQSNSIATGFAAKPSENEGSIRVFQPYFSNEWFDNSLQAARILRTSEESERLTRSVTPSRLARTLSKNQPRDRQRLAPTLGI